MENNVAYPQMQQAPTANTCTNCGAVLNPGQSFCPYCGATNRAPGNTCKNCGFTMEADQEFCPRCGQKSGLAVDAGVSAAIDQFNSNVQQENKKKSLKLPIIIGLVVVAVVALFFLMSGPSVESISITSSDLELRVDDTANLEYEILPADASDVKVTWKSSNTSVATVNSSGKVTAVGAGSCTITVTADGKTDSISVTVITLTYQEKKLLGTWDLDGYYDGSQYKSLPASSGSFAAYDDFTGKMIIGDETYWFEWKYVKQDDDMYIYQIKQSSGTTLAVGVTTLSGVESVVVSLDEMMIVFQ